MGTWFFCLAFEPELPRSFQTRSPSQCTLGLTFSLPAVAGDPNHQEGV